MINPVRDIYLKVNASNGVNRDLVTVQRGGGTGDGLPSPCHVRVTHFFGLGIGQSTVMRVPSVVPETSARGLPTPTASKLGGQSLKSKVPL